MANTIQKPDDFAKSIFDDIKIHGKAYQEQTGCDDGKRALFENALLNMTALQIQLTNGFAEEG